MKSSSTTNPSTGRSEYARALGDPTATELQRVATERMASLGTLAAAVAHQLDSPLCYVLGSLELGLRELQDLEACLRGRSSQELAHVYGAVAALDSARQGAERMRNIVRDVMDVSRASASGAELADVEAVLDATIRVAWNEIRHRARVIKQYASVPRVRGEEARLSQVFVTLLMNAAQASVGEPSANEITVSTSRECGAVVVQIGDTGRRIGEPDVEQIFGPFDTIKAPGSGVGLGLAICRDIVTALGGEISVSSQPGRGTSFRVVLPFAPETSASRRAVLDTPPESESVSRRILIIDDEPLLGQTLLYAFKGRHDVTICTSGRDALVRLATDWRFDLVLCDLMMPDVSGAAVYESVKQTHPELVPRFVFMTGGAFTERAREFLSQHPGLQLEKPFNIGEIEKMLRQFAAFGPPPP